ncbi:hypothetical protein DL766_006390 [Monosporascus sp. MC13-8B]|uniref:Cupin 2 conserved barrel domain-containing protein n=1 Tax=Monosporascus cannonballus TaxID=155416 RepID=A0ABY0GSL5_9PEZI|nr:hypothetical protein DL762_009707 [Monosporascus cannonballus]RYO77684.1 hypothetical protein DL763_009921 [Monosporascus cannonballus]RYP27480.1 hypothetical protein DL766_006390 [Monosporascus sp. MC13-8B]
MASKNTLPAPRRIIASNLPLPRARAAEPGAEPGVHMAVDVLEPEPILGGSLMRTRVATSKRVPTSNDGFNVPLDDVPGAGIVLPGGLNVYYLDLAPNTEGTMHRTTSTDYLVIVEGTLSLMTPPQEPYTVNDGKATYGEPVETLCQPGEVVLQRGMMHALSNRTDKWARILVVVADSEPNRVPIEPREPGAQEDSRILGDAWLA